MEPEIKQNVKFDTNVGKYMVSSEAFVDFIFNEKCNCNCKFCIANVNNKVKEDLDTWKKHTEAMFKVFDIKDIIILGGESTIDPYFFEKVDFIGNVMNKTNRNIILTTNGIMLRNKNFLDKLCKTVITTVNISYMNADRDKNISVMRGNVLTVDELKEIRKTLNNNNMTLRLNSNVFRGNCDNVKEILFYIDTLKDAADAIKFAPLIKTDSFGTESSVSNFTDEVVMSQEEIDLLFDEVCKCGDDILSNDGVFGYVKYNELTINGCKVLLKHSQLSELFDKNKEIANLKMYPNGNLSNLWCSTKNDNNLNYLLENVD